MANGYSGYVTTPEEYSAQRYEGASTLYGPHTLGAYMQTFDALTTELVQTKNAETQTRAQTRTPHPAARSPQPRAGGLQNTVPPVDVRWPPWRSFGDCLGDVEEGDIALVVGGEQRRQGNNDNSSKEALGVQFGQFGCAMVGGCTHELNLVDPSRLKGPGFNP